MGAAWFLRETAGSNSWAALTDETGTINGSAQVLDTVERDLAFTWLINSAVERDLSLLWQLDASPITAVESDLSITWSILVDATGYVERDLTFLWQRNGSVSNDLSLWWQLIMSIANSSGTAFTDEGVMVTTFLDDGEAVPATFVFCNGFAHAQDGSRYVALWPGSGVVYYRWNGIAARSDGAMVIDPSGTITQTAFGVGLTYRGEVVSAVDTPETVDDTWGLLNDGTLCVTELA